MGSILDEVSEAFGGFDNNENGDYPVICNHENRKERDGVAICKDCGCEIEELDFQQEWKNYSVEGRSSQDLSRCHRSKESTKGNIDKVFIDCKIDIVIAIKKEVEARYKKVVGNNTIRGKGRKAVVAACLLHVYRDKGDIKTSDQVRALFGLTKQQMSDGITDYLKAHEEDRKAIVKPRDLISNLLNTSGISLDHKKVITEIADYLEKVKPNSILNRSSPQSVASSIIYLYLCMKPGLKKSLGLTKTKFSEKIGLSDITITKLVKEASKAFGVSVEL